MDDMPDGVPSCSAVSQAEFARLMGLCLEVDAGRAPTSVVVAVSGGADSMALCLLTCVWAQKNDVALTALTVDHGLRKNSADEATQVGTWLAAQGIRHHILKWIDGAEVQSRVQERARDARYALMRDWCLDHGVKHVLVAHHQEDQAETVLMRLKKGSGLLGLAGMARVRDLGGVQLLRPLLDVEKSRLRQTLEAVGQDWVEDPSNDNPVFERVRTRLLLTHLEHEGVSARRLATAARAVARVRTVLENAADDVISQVGSAHGVGGLCVDAKLFLAAPRTVRQLVLAKLLAQVGGGGYPPARSKLESLLTWMKVQQDGSVARTLGGCTVRRVQKRRENTHAVLFLISPEGPRKGRK